MASTQQLVVLSKRDRERCQRNVQELMKVVSYRALSRDSYLDLNWFPVYFRRFLKIADRSLPVQEAFSLAVDGEHVVNSDFPEYEVDEMPKFISAGQVKRIMLCLKEENYKDMARYLPEGLDEVNALLSADFVEHPAGYFEVCFDRLKDFIAKAAERDQEIIVWWN